MTHKCQEPCMTYALYISVHMVSKKALMMQSEYNNVFRVRGQHWQSDIYKWNLLIVDQTWNSYQ